MDLDSQDATPDGSAHDDRVLSRRRLLAASAWSVPAITLTVAAPAAAASTPQSVIAFEPAVYTATASSRFTVSGSISPDGNGTIPTMLALEYTGNFVGPAVVVVNQRAGTFNFSTIAPHKAGTGTVTAVADGAVGHTATLEATPLSSSQRFGYTGVEQRFVVPTGVSSLVCTVAGAGGTGSDRGGHGGVATATLRVRSRQGLRILVGGVAKDPAGRDGGYPGGGNGGTAVEPGGINGLGGGGYSAIFDGVTPLIVAGGGGGAAAWFRADTGGDGGGYDGTGSSGGPATGGSQTGGGTGANSGSALRGGDGEGGADIAESADRNGGGGGGGGLFGGGGGARGATSGGGGSGYLHPRLAAGDFSVAENRGLDGWVLLGW